MTSYSVHKGGDALSFPFSSWRIGIFGAAGIAAGGRLHTGHQVASNSIVYYPFGLPIVTAVLLLSLNWFYSTYEFSFLSLPYFTGGGGGGEQKRLAVW